MGGSVYLTYDNKSNLYFSTISYSDGSRLFKLSRSGGMPFQYCDFAATGRRRISGRMGRSRLDIRRGCKRRQYRRQNPGSTERAAALLTSRLSKGQVWILATISSRRMVPSSLPVSPKTTLAYGRTLMANNSQHLAASGVALSRASPSAAHPAPVVALFSPAPLPLCPASRSRGRRCLATSIGARSSHCR